MAVITISRQHGGLGSEVARRIADRLSYQLVWRELINQAAIQAGAPETALAAIDEFGLLGIYPSPEARLAYRRAVEDVMKNLATQGNIVIVGRAGQVILSGNPDSLHIRICAPKALRIERIALRHQITIECAQAQVEASDRFRAYYLKRFYHRHWDDPDLYHIIINTGLLQVVDAADLVIQAIEKHTEKAHSQ